MSNVDNEAHQIGRISDKKGPSLRQTRKGTYVSNFTIAVDRHYTNSNGSTPADYHQCTAFGKLANNIHKYESKGDLVAVSGELRNHTSPYTVQIGNQSRTIHITNEVIVVDSIRFFRSAKDYKNGQQNGSNQPVNNGNQPTNQPNQPQGNNTPFGNNGMNGSANSNANGGTGLNPNKLSRKVDQASGNAPVGGNAPQNGSNTPFGSQSNGNNAPANGTTKPTNGPQGNTNPKGGKNPKDFPF